ncbi:MAG TPA: ROK family protein [Acidimicrobiia bacterium]|nr:ROK family protein [Acidimicrobiia bacterium]
MRAVGIDLGGTKMSIGVVESDGRLIDEYRVPKPDTWKEMKALILKGVRNFQEKYEIAAVGFGAAGLIDLDGYAFYSPNVAAFDEGAPLSKDLSDELDIPVFVDNDNNCSGLAEVLFGSARGESNVLTVGLGTGIGGSIFIDGRLMRGAHGFAGELGHFTMDVDGPLCACGQYGCFEAFASGTALGRIGREFAARGDADNVLREAGSIDAITGTHVGVTAARGDADGVAIMDEFAQNVARGLVSLNNIFDPSVIVISGGVVELGDTLLGPVTKHFLDNIEGGVSRPLPRIVFAQFGENAGLIGAGALALTRLSA